MCWEGKEKNRKVAKKNIPVKKILYKDNKSPFQGFLYENGKEYKSELDISKKWEWDSAKSKGICISSGIHCYSNNCIVKELKENGNKYICIFSPLLSSVGNFFKYFFKYLIGGDSRAFCLVPYVEKTHKIVEGFIPTGSTYYKNKKGEIVSEKLVLTIPKEDK